MSTNSNFYYANSVQIAVSPFDFSLKFMRNEAEQTGTVVPEVPAGTRTEARVVTADSMVIGMSPAHAKAMLPAMYAAIVEYEREFGRLGLAPDVQANFDNTFSKLIEKK